MQQDRAAAVQVPGHGAVHGVRGGAGGPVPSAVGYQAQAHDASHEEPAVVLNSLVETVRPTG
ncbi:hypothetical protein AB0P24_46140, partial [Streptomyces sp. NPDC086519]